MELEPNSLEELIDTRLRLVQAGLFDEAHALDEPIQKLIKLEWIKFRSEKSMERGSYGFIN